MSDFLDGASKELASQGLHFGVLQWWTGLNMQKINVLGALFCDSFFVDKTDDVHRLVALGRVRGAASCLFWMIWGRG